MTTSCKAWNSHVEYPSWEYKFHTKEVHGNKFSSAQGNQCLVKGWHLSLYINKIKKSHITIKIAALEGHVKWQHSIRVSMTNLMKNAGASYIALCKDLLTVMLCHQWSASVMQHLKACSWVINHKWQQFMLDLFYKHKHLYNFADQGTVIFVQSTQLGAHSYNGNVICLPYCKQNYKGMMITDKHN